MNAEEARAMLAVIPADNRETWVRAGMAVHSALGDAGRSVFHEWSATSDSYRERDCEAVWRSFRGGGRVGAGTLIWMARQHGFTGRVKADNLAGPVIRRPTIDRGAEAEAAAQRAQVMIRAATLATHPYLSRKGFPSMRGYVDVDSRLLVPAFVGRTVSAVQAITPAGVKRYLPRGCRMSAACHRLGRVRSTGAVWLVEGYATGLSVMAAARRAYRTNDEVLVCFSAQGLAKMGRRYERGRAVVVADNDTSEAGERAAKDTGLPFWLPPGPGDANDWHLAKGLPWIAAELAGFAARATR